MHWAQPMAVSGLQEKGRCRGCPPGAGLVGDDVSCAAAQESLAIVLW